MATVADDAGVCPQTLKTVCSTGRACHDHGAMTTDVTSLPRDAVRRSRRRRAEALADDQCGIVSRSQLYDLGVTRAEVRANLRADRWRKVGRQSICVHRGPLSQEALHWAAVHEAGPRAYLDGGSALIAAGLKGFSMERIRVSVPRGARVWRVKGLDVRQTRRWHPDDLAPGPLRRSRVEVAAVRHGLWARTEREGAFALTASVQQGLTTAELIGEALLAVKRDKRRAFVHGVVMGRSSGSSSRSTASSTAGSRRSSVTRSGRTTSR